MSDNYSTLELRVIESAVAFIRSRDVKSKVNTKYRQDHYSGDMEVRENARREKYAASKASASAARELRRSVYELEKANQIATERKGEE